MTRVLVVDDEVKLLRLIELLFAEEGWAVRTATRAEAAAELLAREEYDLLVTDVRLPQRSGIDLLRDALDMQPDLQAIVITAYGTVGEAVDAMRIGAFDYLLKPFEMEGLRLIAQQAVRAGRARRDLAYLRSRDGVAAPGRTLVTGSPAMQEVAHLIDRVRRMDTSVLLLGESGVGKELVAETIHEGSPRQERPLVRVNCPAIPRDLLESELFGHVRGAFTGANAPRKGKFALADGGTIFLDEIGDLPAEQQGKLLHVLERRRFSRVGSSDEIEVDVRILAATNRDLEGMVELGEFRADLFHRLNVFPIRIPPLRERTEDLADLVDDLLVRLRTQLGLSSLRVSDGVLAALGAYPWPGNVRELRNVLERAAVLAEAGTIETRHLPFEILHPPSCATCGDAREVADLNEAVEQYKVQAILAALRSCGWRKKEAAARLGLSPRALSHYIQRHDLERHR